MVKITENCRYFVRAGLAARRIGMCFSLLLAVGCGKQTVQDSLNQGLDRERANSIVLRRQYREVEGFYETDPSVDQSSRMIKLQVDIMQISKDGVNTPIPTLVGTIQFWDKPVNGDPTEMSFVGATYDQSILAAQVSGMNTGNIYIKCDLIHSGTNMSCLWKPTSPGASSFRFYLKRTTGN